MQNMYLIKGLRATIYKELLNATVRNQITRLKMGKRPEQTPHKEGMQMQDKHKKRCSTSYIVREIQIKKKTTSETPATTHLFEWPKPRTRPAPNAGEDVQPQELSFSADGNAKWCSHFGRHLPVSYKIKHILTMQSSNALLSIYAKELKTYVYTKIYTLISVVDLLITIKTCKQPTCPSIGDG